MEIPKIARIAVLPDERGLILGKDFKDVLESGVVYEIFKLFDDSLIIRKLGPYSLAKNTFDPLYDKGPTSYSDANSIILYGRHLLTVNEYKGIVSNHDSINL